MSSLSSTELKKRKESVKFIQPFVDCDFKQLCWEHQTHLELKSIDWKVYINGELRTITVSYVQLDSDNIYIHMLSLLIARHGIVLGSSLPTPHLTRTGTTTGTISFPSTRGGFVKYHIGDSTDSRCFFALPAQISAMVKDPSYGYSRIGPWDPNPYVFSLDPKEEPTQTSELYAFKNLIELLVPKK